MKLIRIISFVFISLTIVQFAAAQTDLKKQVPLDPEIRTGKLDNGLTYFIRKNKEPEKRASFYFIQNVGALLEEDNQNGLAHFLEHMAFNGTLHFPYKGIISSLEKHGVSFGDNINASTGHDETVYTLSDVPVDPPGLMDTCLLAMFDWSDYITLSDKEIDAERPVITEEWRTGRNAEFRMMKQYLPVILKDSRYAKRDVIGDLDVITSFRSNTLREFYNKWYRPDLQAVAVVGDFNPDEMERKIKTLFSQLKPAVNPQPRPSFDVPPHKEVYYVLATDKEASQMTVAEYILKKGIDPEQKNMGYVRRQLVIRLMNSMLDTRINDMLQKGNPPFVSGAISDYEIVRRYDALDISAAAKPNQEDIAFQAIVTEAERAKRYGFTNAELERVKADILSDYDNYFKQRDKISNDSYLSGIQGYFLTNEPSPSIDFEYDFVKTILPSITAVEISEFFKSLMADDNRVIVITGPDDKNIKHLTESGAKEILRKVVSSEVSAYKDINTGENLISEPLPGSKITRTTPLKQFGAVEWTLENNVKVVFKKVGYEKDNVILSSFSPGGTSLYGTDVLPSAEMLPAIIETYGLGDFDNVTLEKMMSGKKASAGISLSELTEGVNGSSTPVDFETMMQLLYLRFAKPRFDREAHEAIMTRYQAFVANMSKDPSKIMQDSVSLFLTNYSPRTMVMNPDFLHRVDFEKIRKVYNERFSNASDFTFFIVGNIPEDTAKLMVQKYIGSLKSFPGKENWVDRKTHPPKGKFVRDIPIHLTVPKATVFVSHNSSMKYNSYNNVVLKVIQGILDLVYTEKVREDAGGSYNVSLNISSQKFPAEEASDLIMFDCDPAKVPALKAIIYREIDSLVIKGPSRENLAKTVNNLLKIREESSVHNSYWSNVLYAYYYTGIDVNDPANYEEILKKLTVDDVKKVAALFFSGADVADIVFRPGN